MDRIAPCRRRAPCVPKQHLHEGALLAFKRGAEGWHRAARSLGMPFTTMGKIKEIRFKGAKISHKTTFGSLVA